MSKEPGITPTPAKSMFEGLPNALAREIQDEVKHMTCADGVAFVQSKLDEHAKNETASLVSRVTELEAEIERLEDSTAELSMLAYKWMVRHDMMRNGQYDMSEVPFPSTVDLPDSLRRVTELEKALAAILRIRPANQCILTKEAAGLEHYEESCIWCKAKRAMEGK